MSKNLLAERDLFTHLFRSDDLNKISTYLERNFINVNIESLDKNLVDHLWDIGLLTVKECVVKYNNITKAKNLLELFSKYQHTFSDEIQKGFAISSTALARRIDLDEDSQTEIIGATDTSTSSGSLEE